MSKLFLYSLLAFGGFIIFQSCKHNPSEIVPLPDSKDTTKKDTTKKEPVNQFLQLQNLLKKKKKN